MNPAARVEYALRADDALAEPQVRQVMEYYLAVRMRRFARPAPVPAPRAGLPERPMARISSTPLASVVGLPTDRRVTTVRPAILGRRPPARP